MAPSQSATDAALVARMRTGDATVSDELYRRHVDDVRRVAGIVARTDNEVEVLVGEAFARVFARIRVGAEPGDELRPYLRTVVRRLAIARYQVAAQAAGAMSPTVHGGLPDPDAPVTVAAHRDPVRQAYETLPAHWQQVLWCTEVERRTPAMLAARFQRTPNAVAALAHRAREGLRQAYLSMHATGSMRPECKPFVPMIPALSRGTLAASEVSAITAHLEQCDDCRARHDELAALMSNLPGVLVPALLGYGSAGIGAGDPAGSVPTAGRSSPAGVAADHGRRRVRGSSLVAAAAAVVMLVTVAVVAIGMVTSTVAPTPDDTAASLGAPTGDSDGSDGGEPELGAADLSVTAEPTQPREDDPRDEEPRTSGVAPSPEAAAGSGDTESEPPSDPPGAGDPADDHAGGGEPATEGDESPPTEASAPSPTTGAATSGSGGSAGGQPESEQTTEPADTVDDPAQRRGPPWLCDLVPGWPGCPDDPEPPGSDALCARVPHLPFCAAD